MKQLLNFGAPMAMASMVFLSLLGSPSCINAQSAREARFKKLESRMVYPYIQGSYMSGVIPVDGITEKPAPTDSALLIFDFTQAVPEKDMPHSMNPGLNEVARILNLHAAAGIPKSHIKAVLVFHAGAVPALLHQQAFTKQFQASNPNALFLEQLNKLGCTIVVCGQSLQLRDIPSENLLPFVKVALAAKTTCTHYAAQGYYVFEIKDE